MSIVHNRSDIPVHHSSNFIPVVNRKLRALICFALLLVSFPLLNSQTIGSSSGWKSTLQSRLRLYGDRNWIVVADSAFPVYTDSGIETIVVHDNLPSVLKYVADAISSSGNVRASVFLDKELQFVNEKEYPGVSELRREITATFPKEKISSIPHAQVITRINEAGKTFRILFIKTTAHIPYSSVYMRLDCGYMTDKVGQKIAAAMASAQTQQPEPARK